VFIEKKYYILSNATNAHLGKKQHQRVTCDTQKDKVVCFFHQWVLRENMISQVKYSLTQINDSRF
jgi:hypothetical protein